MRPIVGLQVFAVEPTTAQITWSRLGPGRARLDGPAGTQWFETDGGPGAIEVGGFVADADQAVVVSAPGAVEPVVLRVRTLGQLGEELYRFATMSDMHIGTDHFGFFATMREPHAPVAHPIRCTRAAVGEAVAWGAQRIVVKGDAVHTSRPHTWAAMADIVAEVAVPVDFICGNHDVNQRSTVDPFVAAFHHGLSMHAETHAIDLPGLRLVLMDSSWPQIDIGRWNHLREPVCDALADAAGPAMLIVHHQPQSTPVPMYLPRGIPSPAAHRFLRAARAANPTLMGTSGHTHRHRRRTICGVEWTETGSPKDYPGTWTGYVVHERGVRQVVRRVAAADCIGWTEYTRRAALGLWGHWAPGQLEDRCFVHEFTAASPGRSSVSAAG